MNGLFFPGLPEKEHRWLRNHCKEKEEFEAEHVKCSICDEQLNHLSKV